MLVDTGSPISFLSYRDYVRLWYSKVQLESVETILKSVEGNQLNVYGKATFRFTVQGFPFVQEFVIADIEQLPGILGIDFLERNGADVRVPWRELGLPKGKIRLVKAGTYNCARVQVIEKCRIPAQSEKILPCWTGRFLLETDGVIEANSTWKKQG